jgi:2-polyprenyl-6-methoxyphenol hydroxylase-like FAD-dependent oxidoreductase
MGRVGGHAVVLGGAIGGLVAAQVLASRFDLVTVIDRDELPVEARDRPGVPHGPHVHLLLIAGRLGLEELFPGLTDELIAGGAVPFDPGADLLFAHGGALRVRFKTDMMGISLSRAFLESALRRRITATPNITVRDQLAACGLAGVTGRVTGVKVDGVKVDGVKVDGGEEDSGAGDGGEVIEADLVVDATGRGGGRADRWLEQLGCPAPEVATVKIDVGYTTRLLRRRPDDLPDGGLLSLMAPSPPKEKRAGAAFPIEGDRWVVSLGGWHREHPPGDPEGFAEFAASLPEPHIADLLARAEPLSDPVSRQFPSSRRRYFERLRRLPAGYLALGDAICSFNPLYAQGMTIATLEAIELGRCLDRFGAVSVDMAREYYRAAAIVIDIPWMMATGGDFAYPETTGPKPFGIDLLNRYMRRVVQAAHVSPRIHRLMIEVQHLLTPPSALLRPSTVLRVYRAARQSPVRRRVAPEPAVAPKPVNDGA